MEFKMNKEGFERVVKLIEGSRDYAIHVLGRIIPVPALSPENGGKGEWEKAEVLIELLKGAGFEDIVVHESPDKRTQRGTRPNIIAMIGGKKRGEKRLWIMSHIDVVPPGDREKWHSDPWNIKVDGDRVYGRGTEDNGQGIVTSLVLGRAIKSSGQKPESDLCLLFVADEETGSEHGIQYIMKNHRPFRKEDIVVIPDAGESDGRTIEIAEKSILWTKITIQGEQTHASTPQRGKNAHYAGAKLIVMMRKLYEDFGVVNNLFDPPVSTFEPTKKEANVPNINTIPGEDIFYFDSRILPCYKLDEVKGVMEKYIREIEKELGVKVNVEYVQEVAAPPATSPDSQVVKVLQKAVSELRKIEAKPIGIGGGTVAAYLRKEDIPCAVWATMDETMHGPDEYVKISNVIEDAKVFAYMCFFNE